MDLRKFLPSLTPSTPGANHEEGQNTKTPPVSILYDNIYGQGTEAWGLPHMVDPKTLSKKYFYRTANFKIISFMQ
ncbi:hypothetical protein AYI70_g9550 [Smittium culicis]|uniref:Uncharacterized protein n=1 Tax=Smittium culicis TaxID=133412 RepID=A0A1R1XAR2_9FUNG|nr:hypothetical protein AYI70_g9550 [Smittium culicis]